MKLNYTFLFVIPLASIFLLDNMFMELAAPHNVDQQGAIFNIFMKGLAGIAFLYSAIHFQRMSPPMRFAFFVTTCYVFGLVFESYYKYNSFFIYPHVFLKVLIFYFSFFTYTFYKGNYYLKFSHIVYFILIGFWLNVLIVNPSALSLSSFTQHERGVHSTSVYMLVIPFLYFVTEYFTKPRLYSLGMAFFVLLSIFFFQHRTVWISTAVVLVIYYLLFRFKTETPITLGKILPIATIILGGAIASSAFIFSMHPEVIVKIMDNFSDIENFDKQGTGSWRYIQWMSYLPFIKENLFLGMRFEGFELPIQFYRDDIDKPVFEDGHGHFFHSFYVDVLFYIGLMGLFLYLLQAVYGIWRGLRMPMLTNNQIMLLSFVLSGFVFGISYILPPFFYGVLGWAIVALEEEHNERTSYLLAFVRRRKATLQAIKQRLISH
ncbi:O-antigen ligase family protein [Pontibacter sp. KCTC 32443]|uniref:O-antigen ligase family protein n=1 Tax=Pontibacter TaxID=323449 RepID=UPI00164D55EB|nr:MULTISPECIES: O-antigen ligase family protein [Pontibacter]MBC5772978.1 O-antigen ligase family protein [Pontibacter sp. KCTC 32443]